MRVVLLALACLLAGLVAYFASNRPGDSVSFNGFLHFTIAAIAMALYEGTARRVLRSVRRANRRVAAPRADADQARHSSTALEWRLGKEVEKPAESQFEVVHLNALTLLGLSCLAILPIAVGRALGHTMRAQAPDLVLGAGREWLLAYWLTVIAVIISLPILGTIFASALTPKRSLSGCAVIVAYNFIYFIVVWLLPY